MKRLAVCAVILLLAAGYARAEGTWTTLDCPGAIFPGGTKAYGISGKSKIVGTYVDSSHQSRGFLYDGINWITIPIQAAAISGSNVVGNSVIHDKQLYNLVTEISTTLNAPGSYFTAAEGIDGNNIVGHYYIVSSGYYGYIYDGTNWTTLMHPRAYKNTKAYGISGKNIVGTYNDKSSNYSFLYNGTSWITLNYPGAASTRAYGINNNNIVGYYGDSSGLHGFLYNGRSWITLNYPGATETKAYGISSNNIVGTYWNGSGEHGFLYTIPEPVAEAGIDQTVYAWVDRIAEVALDGSDSNAPDAHALTYKWIWTIDANTYEANDVSPVIELPVGVHTITLIVNDGFSDSQPDDVNITVIEPLEYTMKITSQTINRKSNQPHIQACIELPEGIIGNDIDANEPLALYPGEIKAIRHSLSASNRVFADFDKNVLMAASPDGDIELTVIGKFQSGQYFSASDTVKIIH